MPFNGSGTYSAPASTWNPAVDGTDISSADWAALLSDFSQALSTCVLKDGSQVSTAVVPFAQGLKVAKTLGVGNATPAVTGSGVSFPATQSASSDANTLDDYEEGVWTLTDASGASLDLSNQNCFYIKIGQLVTVWVQVVFPTTANGSNAKFGGLPFTSASAISQHGVLTYNSSVLNATTAANTQLALDQTNGTLSTLTVNGQFSYRAAA